MKYFIWGLILITGISLLSYWLWQQTLEGMLTCADTATVTIQDDLTWLQNQKHSQAELCGRSQNQYQALNSCYQAVSRNYLIPTQLVETIMLRRYKNFPSLSKNRAFLQRACP